MHVAHLIGVHEARIAHHVAAIGQVDRQHRSPAVLDRRRAVVVQAVGDRRVVAARKQPLDPRQERRVDREDVGEGAVLRAGLLDDDLAVALEDVRLDLADVLVDEDVRVERLPTGCAPASPAHRSGTTSRSCAASPARARCAPALRQRRGRPCGLEGPARYRSIEGLEHVPRRVRQMRRGRFELSGSEHASALSSRVRAL